MLIDAKTEEGPMRVGFGAPAVAFMKRVMPSVHREHLLVFYSVELFKRAHAIARPRGGPISEERLETFYQHFEASIPLVDKFERYTKDISLFLYSAERWLLPVID